MCSGSQLSVIYFIVTFLGNVFSDIYKDRFNLKKQLLSNYQKDIVPVMKQNETVKVQMELYLQNIQDLDEPSQVLSSLIHLDILWQDKFLTWNPIHHNGIDKIYFKTKLIWLPDIFIINALKNRRLDEMDDYVFVLHDGTVRWFPSKQLETVCELDVSLYPFDIQKCHILLESWIYDAKTVQLHILNDGYLMTYYSANGEWNFISLKSETYNKTSAGSEYSRLKWIITLRRRSLYHIITVLLPSILLMLLNFASFLIPVDSGEKVGFCVSLFLTLVVCLTLISKSMPSSSQHISYFAMLIAFQLITSAVITFMACINAYMRSLEKTKMSVRCHISFTKANERVPSEEDKTYTWRDIELRLNKVLAICCISTNVLALTLFLVLSVT